MDMDRGIKANAVEDLDKRKSLPESDAFGRDKTGF